jgi:MiaB/RimO family radical SAM methylthiotransferase
MSKIYLKSYGCSANTADAEIARGILTKHGHCLVDNPQNAELNIILTCVVKKPTEQKVSKELRRMEVTEKPLIVAGCMPKSMTEHVEELVPNASLIGPDDIERIGEAVNLALKGEQVSYLNGEPTDRTCLPRIRENNIVHIMPISSGCLGNCSYCIVKFARGKLYSFPAKKIVKDVKDSILSGCKEVWITAEDTATYNSEGVRLPELLNRITSINGEFRVRIGMTTPNQVSCPYRYDHS